MSSDPNHAGDKPAATPGQTPPPPEEAAPARRKPRLLIGSQRDPDAYRPKPRIPVVAEEPAKPRAQNEAAAPPSPSTQASQADESRAVADSFAEVVTGGAFEPVVADTSLPTAAPLAESSTVGPAPVVPPAEGTPEEAAAPPAPARPVEPEDAPRSEAAPPPPPPAADAAEAAEIVVQAAPAVDTAAGAIPSGEEDVDLTDLAERVSAPPSGERVPPPSVRDALPSDLQAEMDSALGESSLEDLLASADTAGLGQSFEPDSRHEGRVLAVRRDDVFVELGGREQGTVPLKQFTEPPAVGETVEVRVVRFHAEEGLYELSVPHAAADVGNWDDLAEGMLVEARVTGHNTGGLECEVNHIRGFIPVSQIAMYRVDDLSEFVDQKLLCLVTEVNPRRRNLVLSRRAVLEREQEEARKTLLESLQPGEVRTGVVRKIMDFGAFVDLGSGVDGLVHISQLGWARVAHPGEVVREGQEVEVKVLKVDPASGKISLSLRELQESPWAQAGRKYPPQSVVRGKVSKLMEFGAFVELEPGVEGLVHISELAHKRVWRASDVVKEGDEVEVLVLSCDGDAQRISLSMKQITAPPEPAKGKDEEESAAPAPAKAKKDHRPKQPLKGGLGRSSGGDQFGLKW